MPDKILNEREWREWARSHDDGGEARSLRKLMTASVKTAGVSLTTGLKLFEFVASTETVDRDGDVIEVGGWEIEDYLKNPVVLFGHDYHALPVGKSVQVGVSGGALRSVIEFTTAEQNPDGHRVYQLVDGGFLNAVSVAFRPLKYVYNEAHSGYDFKEQELLEISIVPVPANPEALIAAGLGGDTARWLQRQLGETMTTEAEVREVMRDEMRKALTEGERFDLGGLEETEVRRIMHGAMAEEVTRTTGRLVDDPDPDGPEVARVREAMRAAMREAVGGPEHEVRERIRDLLTDRLGR